MNSSCSINNRNKIAGSSLKIIALSSMFVDHIGATIVAPLVFWDNSFGMGDIIYYLFRAVGRLSFPIYIFLLIEGIKYTGSRLRYLLRILVFAVVSEIPYDLAFNIKRSDALSGKVVELSYQNVFFTLAAGLIVVILLDYIHEKINQKSIALIVSCIVSVFMLFMAALIRCDYGAAGVAAIIAAYIYRDNRLIQIFMICASLALLGDLFNAVAIIDVYFIVRYNGQRGSDIKWLFYCFYPVHLLALWGICMLL